MIVKMKFISITGPKDDIDRVSSQYLSKYEIQLENALSELKTADNLTPFADINPYKEALARADQYMEYLNTNEIEADVNQSMEDVFHTIKQATNCFQQFKTKEQDLKAKKDGLKEKLKTVLPYRPMDFVLHEILSYRYVKFRFGRIAIDYYPKLEEYTLDNPDVLFVEGARDNNYVYIVYFTSRAKSEKMDAIFKPLHFERIFLPDEYNGTPEEACLDLEAQIADCREQLHFIDNQIAKELQKIGPKLFGARQLLESLAQNFDVRKMAACVVDKHDDFYILCGWMSEKDVKNFIEDIKDDPNLFVVIEDEHAAYFGEPPTKLENPKIFKPFELFTRMYGLPAHDEMDPTIFVALTYTFIFGVMFGDVGQGLCLFIGGALLYYFKKIDLAGIVSIAGVFSTFFGFMFGSIFGFEDVIEAYWLRPTEHMTTLPFIGNLNTVFIVAIVFGMGLVVISMLFHIVNAFRAHDKGNAYFDANGIAGLVFYLAVIVTVFLYMTGHNTPATIVLVVMFGIPLLLIALKEPLTRKLEKTAGESKEGIVMFIVQTFFELFETLLSYFSNTLSFVRIGAFAVSHAAMMGVVLMLSGAEQGHTNWLVIIAGNLVVCLMEGLIVGIQVLRLEYYEMFSRFYKGSGREFKPYKKHTKKKGNVKR